MYLFLLFFVLLLPLILLLLLLLLNDQIANFFGAFTLFQGKELCFFLCSKKFLIRPYSAASYMSLDRKEGVVSKISYHIRQNRVPYLEIKLEMAKNPHFFVSFRLLLLFLPCILCTFFFFFLFYYYHLYYYYFYYYWTINLQIFLGLSLYFKVRNSIFSYVVK